MFRALFTPRRTYFSHFWSKPHCAALPQPKHLEWLIALMMCIAEQCFDGLFSLLCRF